jgi:4'-phosphopantetheinyl transferase
MRDAPVSFNLSHAGALALVALTHAAAVGVDVQATGGRRIDELAIAQRALGAEQASRLARLHPALRRRAFLRAWARHEAALKCHGMGLWSAHDVCARSPAGELWTSVLDLGAEAVGAVALERAPSELRCWSWSASSPSS